MRRGMLDSLGAAIAVALGSAALASAATLYSFETGIEGWADEPPDAVIDLSQGAVGATDGSHSLAVRRISGNTFGFFRSFDGFATNLPAVLANTTVAFDVTVPSDFNGTFMGWRHVWNSNAGFQQSGDVFPPAVPGTSYTVSFDYTAYSSVPADATFLGTYLAINTDATSTVYIDRLRVVPEPAALAGVAAMAMLVRRRR